VRKIKIFLLFVFDIFFEFLRFENLFKIIGNILYRLFDEKYTVLYDGYKKAYAEALHRWELLDDRAQVLKHLSTSLCDVQKGVVELQCECRICGKISRSPQCANCKGLSFQCVVCHITVKGMLFLS
jgi:hypothetical protein